MTTPATHLDPASPAGAPGPGPRGNGFAGLPRIGRATEVSPEDARPLTLLFLERLGELEEGTREHQYVRNTLIEMNLSLVRFVANRFRNRGEGEMEDIVQVGTVGLIKAIDRFDLGREVAFTSFAVPYVQGEIMRYFRDTSWAVHVPRRLQELRVELARARERLVGELDRDPSVEDLAEHLGRTKDEVVEGMVAAAGYRAGSLDTPNTDSDDEHAALASGRSLPDRIGIDDPGMQLVENIRALVPHMAELDERERTILELRFGSEMTQARIGTELGISQMHVSRLLAGTLAKLRGHMLADG
ncbi:SigB/SigF/SigG family RNA polymerase sigma factor [Streptomyces marianii]|uniref:SigB/SigF/SigG family RNA polymerase sigma factor n=1 Tax=Streptomyces marianii TaxID=1817406 RepID=A0A5R9E107_9ACTN|nr:SigB/SigF/SigG family RNA polymerase sigma factor [Streptomyces marianii]TLQ42725.1 SigB/SigF/SigG family RNA polymerase sigma factor [Streptomyces marianii]